MEREGNTEISRSECWDLLKTASLGRLVLSVKALPVLFPVQYYVDGEELAICLGHHEIPDRSTNDAIVAFGADAIDAGTRRGWSVQVRGVVRKPRRPGASTDCGQPTAGPLIYLVPEIITGERVFLCPFVSPLDPA
jgi:hypothetical protein